MFIYRQSSLRRSDEKSTPNVSVINSSTPDIQPDFISIALRSRLFLEFQILCSTGGRKRCSPNGCSAYGTPKNSIAPVLESIAPVIDPSSSCIVGGLVDDKITYEPSNCSSSKVVACAQGIKTEHSQIFQMSKTINRSSHKLVYPTCRNTFNCKCIV